MGAVNDPAVDYGLQLSGAFREVLGESLLAGYLHGSAAMGGWLPGRSDIDLLFVTLGQVSGEQSQSLALAAQRLECPGAGVELSIVRAPVDLPLGPPPFEVHITTGADEKVVPGASHPGDPDLVLHYAVCRARALTLFGPPPEALLPAVPRPRLREALLEELRWAAAEAPAHYAVLNACRAAAFAASGAICSKLEGVAWAEETGFHSAVARQAWERQASGSGNLPNRDEVLELIRAAEALLAGALEREA